MNVHENSLKAHDEEKVHLGKRASEILDFFRVQPGKGYTDREVAELMGFSHRSAVQPRISELVKARQLVECEEKAKCPETNKTVRRVEFPIRADSTGQLEMFERAKL